MALLELRLVVADGGARLLLVQLLELLHAHLLDVIAQRVVHALLLLAASARATHDDDDDDEQEQHQRRDRADRHRNQLRLALRVARCVRLVIALRRRRARVDVTLHRKRRPGIVAVGDERLLVTGRRTC